MNSSNQPGGTPSNGSFLPTVTPVLNQVRDAAAAPADRLTPTEYFIEAAGRYAVPANLRKSRKPSRPMDLASSHQSKCKYPFAYMQLEESFFVAGATAAVLRVAGIGFSNRFGGRFVSRAAEKAGIRGARAWRLVETPAPTAAPARAPSLAAPPAESLGGRVSNAVEIIEAKIGKLGSSIRIERNMPLTPRLSNVDSLRIAVRQLGPDQPLSVEVVSSELPSLRAQIMKAFRLEGAHCITKSQREMGANSDVRKIYAWRQA